MHPHRNLSYAECVAARRCPSCTRRLQPDYEFKLCDICRAQRKKRTIERIRNGQCRRCPAKATHKTVCEKHHQSEIVRSKKRQAKLRAAGLCIRCLAPAKKALCVKCAGEQSARSKRKRKLLRKLSLCTECFAPAIPSMSLCPECREDVAARDAKRQADPVKREAQRQRSAARRRSYAAAGVCTACGKTKPKPGQKRCKKCNDRNREAQRIRALLKRTQKLAAENKPNPAVTTIGPQLLRKLGV